MALGSALLFTLGVLVGQDASGPPFLGKYLRTGGVLQMQVALMNANLDIVRERAGFSSGTLTPSVSFDDSCRCFRGYAFVGSEFMKKPLTDVRNALLGVTVSTYLSLRWAIPEMPEDFSKAKGLFIMTFAQVSDDPAKKTFAEFKDGELTFK
jgi:hypothetical protein